MYCTTCGKPVPENLNYCSGCGTRNDRNALVVGNSSQRPFAIAAAVVGGGGLFGFIPVLKLLLNNPRIDPATMLIILIAYLIAVFLMFSVLVGHIWKHSGEFRVKTKELNEPDDFMTPRSFRSLNTAQLEPAMSVTENTTRTLDHIPLKR